MKRMFNIATVSAAFFLFSFSIVNIDEVINALRAGNAAEIAKYFDNTVEITLPSKSSSYNKIQAEKILANFFSNNPVRSFEVLHSGENAGSQYCIGKLITKNATYRTTIFMKQKGGVHTLQEIRFETQ